jgi:hypothetical protein
LLRPRYYIDLAGDTWIPFSQGRQPLGHYTLSWTHFEQGIAANKTRQHLAAALDGIGAGPGAAKGMPPDLFESFLFIREVHNLSRLMNPSCNQLCLGFE